MKVIFSQNLIQVAACRLLFFVLFINGPLFGTALALEQSRAQSLEKSLELRPQLRFIDKLSSRDLERTEILVGQVIDLLPLPMRLQLREKGINIEFRNLPTHVSGSAVRHTLILSKDIFIGSSSQSVQIRQQWLKNSVHPDLQTLKKAILAHELSHVYDLADRDVAIAPRASADEQFQRAAGFRYFGFFGDLWLQRANFSQSRSPDIYEWKNPQEAFAVNMEYYLLDSQFKCRRPTVYAALEHKFNFHNPFPNVACELHRSVLNSNGLMTTPSSQLFNLDPARIYQIHYLFASKGRAVMSRFGHGMLRLIVCAPERNEVGPACLEDLAYHVVLTYRAAVEDLKINIFKGLDGRYPSLYFFLPMTAVMDEYNRRELRDLISIPLKISEAEKASILQTAVELHWTYKGKYKFFSNNCADEALQHLRLALPARAELGRMGIARPDSLYHKFIETGFADGSVVKSRAFALENGYLFSSKRTAYQAYLKNLLESGWIDKNLSLDEYLESTLTSRQRHFAKVMQIIDKREKRKLVAAMFGLEDVILQNQKASLQASQMRQVLALLNAPNGSLTAVEENVLRVVAQTRSVMAQLNSPALWLQGLSGYGIPTDAELQFSVAAILERMNSQVGDVQDLGKLLEPLQNSKDIALAQVVSDHQLFYSQLLREFRGNK